MTDDRPYRAGMSLEDAVEEVQRHSGTPFDPVAVDALLALDRARVRQLLQLDRARVITLV
jgi:HD-GYP domain-containing protein (c-di-GMP phosphodiesterase class II)